MPCITGGKGTNLDVYRLETVDGKHLVAGGISPVSKTGGRVIVGHK